MKVVIMAGGSGTRLWPLSRKNQPKQLLKLVNDKTLLQNTYSFASKIVKPKDIFLAVGGVYSKQASNQLPKFPKRNFFVEPTYKELGPAVGLASLLIDHVSPHSPIFVAWADHFYEPESKMVQVVKKAGAFVRKHPDKVVRFGVKPVYPHPGLGYIEKGRLTDKSLGMFTLKSFTHSPGLAKAEEFCQDKNYLWNVGSLVFSSSYMLDMYKQYLPEVYEVLMEIKAELVKGRPAQKVIDKWYPKMPRVDFEKGIMEKLHGNLMVMESDVRWADVGSFQVIKDVLSQQHENLVKGLHVQVTSNGNLIYNFSEKQLVALAGVRDSVVLVTEEVVLIAAKHESERIKEILKIIENDPKLNKYL